MLQLDQPTLSGAAVFAISYYMTGYDLQTSAIITAVYAASVYAAPMVLQPSAPTPAPKL